MEKVIKGLEDVTLSGEDVLKICNNNANLFAYHNITQFHDINQLFDNKPAAIILYEKRYNFGHWVTLIRFPDHFEFFDSLGYHYDQEELWADPKVRPSLNEDEPYLTELLESSGLPITYNKHKLQESIKDVNTCGRWAGFRALLHNTTNEEFYDLFKDLKCYKPDFWVTCFTMLI